MSLALDLIDGALAANLRKAAPATGRPGAR